MICDKKIIIYPGVRTEWAMRALDMFLRDYADPATLVYQTITAYVIREAK